MGSPTEAADVRERRSVSDGEWGRARGARPPLEPRAVLLWWLTTASVLVAVVVAVIGSPGPLDDPDPGEQRAGFLFDPGEAPVLQGLQLPGDPLGEQPVFLLFDRRGYDPDRVAAVRAEVPERFAFFVVVPEAQGASPRDGGVRVVADPRQRLAQAVDLSEPVAGGFPTGYSLIDSGGRVRYATLDPTYAEHAFEVDIVVDPVT
jgi:hypothetical protein